MREHKKLFVNQIFDFTLEMDNTIENELSSSYL